MRNHMKRLWIIAFVLLLAATAGCSSSKSAENNESVQAQQNVSDSSFEDVSGDVETDIPDAKAEEGNTGTVETAEMVVRITIGERTITATLYDNEATRALWEQLPQTFPMMNLYGREMCYRMGNGALPDQAAQDIGYEVGDISYWPPAGSLVILYKQNGEVFEQVQIGHTDDDVSFFDGMEDTDITFEKAD